MKLAHNFSLTTIFLMILTCADELDKSEEKWILIRYYLLRSSKAVYLLIQILRCLHGGAQPK